jgi:hypothetical protein
MYISLTNAKRVGPAVLSGPRADHPRPKNPYRWSVNRTHPLSISFAPSSAVFALFAFKNPENPTPFQHFNHTPPKLRAISIISIPTSKTFGHFNFCRSKFSHLKT